MGLAALQTALARLYTDDAWRAEFFQDPERAGALAGLTPQETRQLAALPAADVDFFALTLRGKRLQEVCKLLPLTRRAYGPAFDEGFRAFTPTFQPDGPRKHLDDALAFAAYLSQKQSAAPAWAADARAYETARLTALRPARCCLARRFRHALKPLLFSLRQPDAAPVVIPQFSVAVWLRPSPQAPLYHWLWR